MDTDSRLFAIAGWAGIALLAIAMVVVAVRGDWLAAAVLGAFLIASALFVALEGRLPTLFDALFVLAAIINAAGWVWDLFERVRFYDDVAHFYTSFAFTLSLGYLTFFVMRRHFVEHRWHFVLVVTSFGIALGAWWEMAEWLMLKELDDTGVDIILDSLGALLAAVVAVWALGRESRSDTSRSADVEPR